MHENRKRRQINWSSLIGWLIFFLIIGGQPLLRLLQQMFGRTGVLPANIIPFLIGGLVVLSVIISAVRALNNSSRSGSDVRLPTDASTSQRPTNTPMPPFSGTAGRSSRAPAPPLPRAPSMPSNSSISTGMPQSPRFDPVISPAVLLVGILGLVGLGGVGLLVLLGSAP